MSIGLDTMSNTQSQATCIKNAGYSFVCRYYNTNAPSKNLTKSEAIALSNAGLYNVSIWENGYPTSSSYFSLAKGQSDGAAAYNYAKNTIGQPSNTPIYFAVDYDASQTDIEGVISQYFAGITSAFNDAGTGYSIGVYGSGATISYIYNNFYLVTHRWQAQSTGWRGYDANGPWELKQGSGFSLCNLSCDHNTSNGNAGGWQVFN